ncbi:unnamed protein product [Phytophthora fragariaefolia]|uniref:Unnamed protein product n=1 Tax=Phytophthora fragariaefolia TaxID=1490495 RepID=A0A9W7D8B7_9STRA|nr:unnamed protein product [Phytophthora fragariaefolia]
MGKPAAYAAAQRQLPVGFDSSISPATEQGGASGGTDAVDTDQGGAYRGEFLRFLRDLTSIRTTLHSIPPGPHLDTHRLVQYPWSWLDTVQGGASGGAILVDTEQGRASDGPVRVENRGHVDASVSDDGDMRESSEETKTGEVLDALSEFDYSDESEDDDSVFYEYHPGLDEFVDDVELDSEYDDEAETFRQDDDEMRSLERDIYGQEHCGKATFYRISLHDVANESEAYRKECIPPIAQKTRQQQLDSQAKDPKKAVDDLDIIDRLEMQKPIKEYEILHVIGLLVDRTLCGHTDGPEKHWTVGKDGAVPRVTFGRYMKRDRFRMITRFLPFTRCKGQTNDKAFKIRPILQVIEKTFRRGYRLGPVVSFDEGTIPNRSQYIPIRVYNKDKHHKYGTKYYMTCYAETGYCTTSPVHMISTGCSTTLTYVTRKDKKTGAITQIPCPRLVANYHSGMGGVDTRDQIRLQRYSIQRCVTFKKYYRQILLAFVDMAVVNGFILHKNIMKRKGERVPTHAEYMRQLHVELLAATSVSFRTNRYVEDLASVPTYGRDHVLRSTTELYKAKSGKSKGKSKSRQFMCKVCSTLSPPKVKSFESRFYCSECSEALGGYIPLCNTVRRTGAGNTLTCSQIWLSAWGSGAAISSHLRKRIGIRKRKRTESSGEEDSE